MSTLFTWILAQQALTQATISLSPTTKVWRIENLELVPVDHSQYGFFYGGDCYLVLYTYEVNRKPHHILYIWQVGVPGPSSQPWTLIRLPWSLGKQGPGLASPSMHTGPPRLPG